MGLLEALESVLVLYWLPIMEVPTVLAFDPGRFGGIAYLSPTKIEAMPLPYVRGNLDCYEISSLLKHYNPCCVAIEKQTIYRNQGAKSSATTMKNYGILLGLVYGTLGCNAYTVTPKEWQSYIMPGVGKGQTKVESIRLSKEYYPDVNLFRTPKCTTECDGMSDALLIAKYTQAMRMDVI